MNYYKVHENQVQRIKVQEKLKKQIYFWNFNVLLDLFYS